MTRSRVRASLRRGREELQLGAGGRAASPVAAVPALLAGLVLLRRPLRGAPRRRPLLPLRHQENLRQGQVGEHKDVFILLGICKIHTQPQTIIITKCKNIHKII